MRILIIIFTCIGSFLAIEQLIDLQTKGFCLQKILAQDLPYHPEWESSPPEDLEAIDKILEQPFTLIGSGSECFAFVSQDRQTILKCFKLSFARPVYYRKGLFTDEFVSYAGILSAPTNQWISPLETFHARIRGIREFRILRTFKSCKLAYEHLRPETGVFYIHLNPTRAFEKELTLIDGNGISYHLPIDSTRFILQKKATLLEDHFRALLDSSDQEGIIQSIDSLLSLIESRCQKGFADRDFINRNIGYIGNRAIEIDLGSFTPDPLMKDPHRLRKEMRLATKEFKKWLKKIAPEWAAYLTQKIDSRAPLQSSPLQSQLESAPQYD